MHKNYCFSNILGIFIFNEHLKVIKSELFTNNEQYLSSPQTKAALSKQYHAVEPTGKSLDRIHEHFSDVKYDSSFVARNIELTKLHVKESVNEDNMIIQSVSSLMELTTILNMLLKRLREWYGMYNPETERAIEEQETFVHEILSKDRKQLLDRLETSERESMGGEIAKKDVDAILFLAKQIEHLRLFKVRQEGYLEEIMKKFCPNITVLAGSFLGAKLIHQAGSLKQLVGFPSSTVQVLGAEKALFRHMKTGARSPRHGYIAAHPLLASAVSAMHGKIARGLADKILLCAKIDYFKGEFIADKLLKELERKFK
ncbi:MAG: NOP5/NOP56 family protein [Nanoarchaeota archaeon]|nr:NOP5/NOP56 family protein [Nanoarchaeota archaeon]